MDQLILDAGLELTQLSTLDICIAVDEGGPLILIGMVSATHLQTIKLETWCNENIDIQTAWVNSECKNMLEQLSMLMNLHLIKYHISSAGKTVSRAVWLDVLKCRVQTLHIHMDNSMDSAKIDSSDLSNTSIRSVKLTGIQQPPLCRSYMLRCLSMLPCLEDLSCQVHKNKFTNRLEIKEHFVNMRQTLQLPPCDVTYIHDNDTDSD